MHVFLRYMSNSISHIRNTSLLDESCVQWMLKIIAATGLTAHQLHPPLGYPHRHRHRTALKSLPTCKRTCQRGFHPFHTPVVRFTQIILADGTTLPLTTGTATNGAPLLRLVAPPPRQGGFIRKRGPGVQILKDQAATFTAPDKGDRLLQLFYHQLPYHPERIEKGTAWTVETTEPVTIPSQPASPPTATTASSKPTTPLQQETAIAAEKGGRPTWTIQAYLRDELTSATAKSGQPIEAIVAEPVYNLDHTIAVPQGATIVGAITQAKPARSFARAGTLSFDFKRIVLPSGQTQNVQAALTGADSTSTAQLAMDSEGKVKPKPQDKIVVPLLLVLLATRPLDTDHGENNMAGKKLRRSQRRRPCRKHRQPRQRLIQRSRGCRSLRSRCLPVPTVDSSWQGGHLRPRYPHCSADHTTQCRRSQA